MTTAPSSLRRYIVGIDLGTTNCAVAYIDTTRSAEVQHFPIPQLVNEATVAHQPTLPSFLYLPGPRDLPLGSLALPWDREPSFAVGQFARIQGARIPGRLVSSAKSWLCHAGVDRAADILPWDGLSEVKKLSPVAVTARYLQHLRDAWRQEMGKAQPLEAQQIVLTVPASFDEVARELTVQAAEQAGLSQLTLLEEPQAALYAWLAAHADTWQTQLKPGSVIFVCDVGGGTTDLSLITVTQGKTQLGLERIAVGDHLLLGGDNMDVALARRVEARMSTGQRLDTQRWHLLCQSCRIAKEDLFADALQEKATLTLPGRGSSVIGGTLTDSLSRQDIEQVILDGFFPSVEADARPRRGGQAGLQEFGLPYETEPEILRHVSLFLSRHADAVAPSSHGLAQPDAILFNGGALTPLAIRERIAQTLAAWFQTDGQEDWQPAVLSHTNLDLAVAYGAAYYGMVRRGQGVRIGGGSARSYYIGVGGTAQNMNGESTEQPEGSMSAVCLVRRGMEEGEEVHLTEQEFEVLANRPVSFPLYASSTRSADQPGELLTLEIEQISLLPPIRTVLRFGKKARVTKIPVHVSARFTEVGTLELWCEARQTDHRWRLQFQLRGEGRSIPASTASSSAVVGEEQVIDESRLDEAAQLIHAVFSKSADAGEKVEPQTLARQLETALGTTRDSWPLSAIRCVWDVLWEDQKGRALDPEHEARWLNLAGFLLRPGFGHPTDEWRMQQLWKMYGWGLLHAQATQCRAEWWNMWKRVAGGLSRQQQTVLYTEIAPCILPQAKNQKKSGGRKVGPQEIREMWQVAGSCERLNVEAKYSLAEALVRLVEKAKVSDQELWALARLGARALIYGPANCVVQKEKASRWVERLLKTDWRKSEATAFAVTQIARCTGDRSRDLDESLREPVAERVASFPSGQRWARQVREVVRLEAKEQARILDESLPVGLQIRSGEDSAAS